MAPNWAEGRKNENEYAFCSFLNGLIRGRVNYEFIMMNEQFGMRALPRGNGE
ncbi:hypothetical protein C943_01308 [Mariniradius saccharolyticus AK6]|uniref:Uncharacterized protein n=1 Tax=Mariniradius saccharolyticus AK6 TaxID=1239962 RepID=M7Y5P5_9BACT|nr:hypothetical protein C943_01308 [Mariniradius saccharolyticus AK6]